MNFNEIKQFIPTNSERLIVIENGKPIVVLLSFEEYKAIISHSCAKSNNEVRDMALKIQPQIQSQPGKTEQMGSVGQDSTKELTLEDLPF